MMKRKKHKGLMDAARSFTEDGDVADLMDDYNEGTGQEMSLPYHYVESRDVIFSDIFRV